MNSLIQWYRQQVPNDPASDEEIILDYGSRYHPDELPDDFRADYERLQQIGRVGESSLGAELGAGFKRGVKGLQSAGAGALALLSDVTGAEGAREFYQDIFTRKNAEMETQAPASVPRVEGAFASPASMGQYLAGKVGELGPNIGEAVALAGAGTLVAPGPGTEAGAIAGLFARGAARSAIKRALEKGMTAEIRGEIEGYAAGKVASSALSKEAAALIDTTSKYIAGSAVSVADAAVQGAGQGFGVLSDREGVSPADARMGAVIAGVGGSIGAVIPIRILKGVFGEEIGEQAARSYVDLYAKQIPTEVLAGSGGMGAMEFFNVLSEKYADPKARDQGFTKEDYSRILNAAAIGTVAGVPAAAIKAVKGVKAPSALEVPVLEPAPEAEPAPAMTAKEVVTAFPQPISREQELVMRQVAERELTEAITEADQVYLRQLPPAVYAKYRTLRSEVSNAPNVRKEQARLQEQREGDRRKLRQEEDDRSLASKQPKKGDQNGPGNELQEAARELAPPIKAALVEQGINPETIAAPASHPNSSIKQAPEPERFDNVSDLLKFRETRRAEEIDLYVEQIGLSKEEATRLQSLLAREGNTKNFEANLSKEKAAKMEWFFEESPFNQVGSSFQTWGWDPSFNPSDVAAEKDVSALGNTLVHTLESVPDASSTNDRFLSAVIAARRFKEQGGTQQDLAKVIDRYTTRISGSQSDKESTFVLTTKKVGDFLRSQGLDIPESSSPSRIGSWQEITPDQALAKARAMAVEGVKPQPEAKAVPASTWVDDVAKSIAAWRKPRPGKEFEDMYSDLGRDASDKSKTKALGVFETPGGKIMVATIYDNRGKKVSFPTGGLAFETVTNNGFKPLGYIKTDTSRSKFHTEYTKEQWNEIQPQLESKALTAREAITLPIAEEAVGAATVATGAVTPEGLTVGEARGGAKRFEQPIAEDVAKERLTEVDAERLHDGLIDRFGNPDPESIRDNVNDVMFADRGLANRMLELGRDKSKELVEYIGDVYEETAKDFAERGTIDPAEFRSAIAKKLVGSGKKTSKISGVGDPSIPKDIRYSRPVETPREPGTPELAAVGAHVLERLNRAGITTTQIQSEIGPLVDSVSQSFGSFDRAKRAVNWVLADLEAPTRSDIRVLFEEAGHALYDSESPETRDPILRAISRLNDRDPSELAQVREDIANAPGGVRPETYQEELLMGYMSRKLSDEGFSPVDAGGIARAIVRVLKEVYLKASMWIQKNLLGKQYDNPDLALRYFQNRLEGFMAGDQETLSWINRLGGGKPSRGAQLQWSSPAEGSKAVVQTYNPVSQQVETAPILIDSVEAAVLSGQGDVRYSVPSARTTPYVDPSVGLNRDAAVNNKIADVRKAAAEAAGIEAKDFRTLNGLRGNTETIQTVLGKAAIAREADGFNPMQRIEDFGHEQDSGPTYVRAAAQLKNEHAKISKNLVTDKEALPRALESKERQLTIAQRDLDRYTDAEFMAGQVKENLRALTRDDLRAMRRTSQALGVIMQQVQNLDGRLDRPVDPAVVGALKKLFTGTELQSQNLFELLDFMANDPGIDFTRPATEIRQYIRTWAETHPDVHPYQLITHNTPEGRALLATVIGFGKVHNRTMTLLRMRRMESGVERAALETELSKVWKETREQIDTGIRRVARGARLQEVARAEYRRALRKVLQTSDEVKDLQTRIDVNEKAIPAYQREIDKIAGRISQTEDSTFSDGMIVRVPKGPGVTPEWENKTINLNSAAGPVTTSEEIMAMADQISEFTLAREDAAKHGSETALGLDYQRAKRQLNEIVNNRFYEAALRNTDHHTTELVVSSSAKKMDTLGTASGNIISTLMRKFVSGAQEFRNQADKEFGYKNPRLEQQAIGILNRGRKSADKISHDWFGANVLDASIGFMEKMQPTEGVPEAADLNRAYGRLGEWLMSQDALRPYLNGRMAEFMPVIRELIDSLYASGQFWNRKNEEAGLLVQDSKLGGQLRRAFKVGLITVPRKFSDMYLNLVHALRASGWAGNGKDDLGAYGDFATAKKLYAEDRAGLDSMVSKYFDHEIHGDTVRSDFWYKLTHVPDESIFRTPEIDESGTTVQADPQLVASAFDHAKGDVIKTLENMHEMMGGTGDVGQYVQDQLLHLAAQFHEADQALKKVEPATGADVKSLIGLVPNAMIDSRGFAHWPAEWFNYHKFDRNDNARMAERISAQIHFGRDNRVLASSYETLAKETAAFSAKLKDVLARAERSTPSGREKDIEAKAEKILALDKSPSLAKFKTGKEKLEYLKKVDARRPFVEGFVGEISDYFNRGNQDVGSLRWGVRLAQELASLMVNQITSAISQLATMFDITAQWGTSPSMLRATGRTIQLTAKDLAGSLAQGVGWGFLKLRGYEQRFHELGLVDPEVARRFGDIFATLEGEQHNRGAQAFRMAKDLQSATLNRVGEGAKYTALRPLAPFSQGVIATNRALTIALWELADRYVARGVDYLRTHPGADKITADHLKLKGLERDSFEKWQHSIEGYGLRYTEMAKGAMERATTGDKTVLTNRELGLLYSLGLNEVSLENNIATMPLAAFNNSVLRFISPLLGWSFRRSLQMAGHRMDAKDKRSMRALSHALLGLSTAGLGGLGLSLVVDAYQEDVLGKKRNIRDLRIPTTGSDWLAIQERVNRIGTLGLFGEAINSAVNIGTGQGENRLLSADQRIVALQSFQSLQRSISSLINQNFDPDYQHVVRPFLSAVGGNGLLQYMQIANHAFDLDNAESRVVKRINAQNYLRVTGRDLGMPIRVGSQTYGTPTPMTPWIARMEFAAYANSPEDFRTAYRGAVAEAKDLGKADAADYVKRAYETRHPLRSVFAQVPSESEYHRALAAMDETGRGSVTDAVRLFNYYGAHIGSTPFQGSKKKNQSAGSDRAAKARAMAIF